ncbi:Hydroxyethylthiazole kinase [Candidatus Magnetomoraceae bacterium gMMP-13]
MSKAFNQKLCNRLIGRIQKKSPLIHHITNWVTIYDCAQITRSIGGLPVMAHAKEEVTDMIKLSSALALNIGTLTNETTESMILAGKAANIKGIPIVLDMVGCGATPFRTAAVKKLIKELNIAIIKGNSGETASAAGIEAEVKGVESISVSGDIIEISKEFARLTTAVVIVTGPTDIITDGNNIHFCEAGHPFMGQVVGTGCMAGSVLASFASVADNYFESSVCAMNFYGKAGEQAALKAKTPMFYKNEFIDCIHSKAIHN